MYRFQLLAIDTIGESEIESLNALKHGILSSDKLLKDPQIHESDNRIALHDQQSEVTISISMVDTSQVLNDLIDAAFVISLEGENAMVVEGMRTPLLIHLRKRLLFSNLRILIDDVSANIAQSIYPIINDVELRLRKYLMQFFIQKVGVNWWQLTAPRPFIEKVNSRRFKFKDLSEYVTLDVSLIDFDDLGELIYKHNTGFQRSEALIEKLKQVNTIEELHQLKKELENNYTRFFKETFQDKDFEKKWLAMIDVRNRVAHNSYFTNDDLLFAQNLHNELVAIIENAEVQITSFRFSVEEQQIIRERTIQMAAENEEESEIRSHPTGLKILGKIQLPESHMTKIITEDDLVDELYNALEKAKNENYPYLGLKYFVTKYLADKGYATGPSYALVNILKEKGFVDFYDVTPPGLSYPVKALRLER
jgi:uncharacterized protein with HEPN domain